MGLALCVGGWIGAWWIVKGKLNFERLVGQVRFYDRLGFYGPHLARSMPIHFALLGALGSVFTVTALSQTPSFPKSLAAWAIGGGLVLIAAVLMPVYFSVIRWGRPRRFVIPQIRDMSNAELRRVFHTSGRSTSIP